jgi:hypothetical protein
VLSIQVAMTDASERHLLLTSDHRQGAIT